MSDTASNDCAIRRLYTQVPKTPPGYLADSTRREDRSKISAVSSLLPLIKSRLEVITSGVLFSPRYRCPNLAAPDHAPVLNDQDSLAILQLGKKS